MRISNTLARLRSCKQPEGAIKGKYGVELPDACGSSCIKPEVAASGFSVYLLLELQIMGQSTRDPVRQSQTGVPSNRRETKAGSNQKNDMDF
jgi:hypothetical protein